VIYLNYEATEEQYMIFNSFYNIKCEVFISNKRFLNSFIWC